ncbi:cyclin-like protein [Neohortaea acidophila]|uniref:RNA polymerase II holoenzyme cyclin-like subunit n=1 Tax=Neohortaea acidophila TaxID=245834 RepID=A0A6A6Q6M0_9PEZI|nr:cyclin-like protein [Neohortaea acidophila]KAF2487634.1 cyclin-like protein [Neohortaea acidophila]
MPPPSNTNHLPSSHPATRQRPKSPNRVLAEAEAQWTFTEAELANTPSIQDGMSQAEEQDLRAKGVNFIVQVGIMLKLPQLTLSTAAIFFQRFLMRASLKKEHNGIPKLHQYQAAATALFLATKVEESCRKMKELILAFCRVAQKNPNLIIDEQSKDWWRWRDCILHNEDVLLETLCFDLTVESPHRQLFELLKFYGLEHNKRLRNAAWSFVTDSNNTQLCLLCTSRTIAIASLHAACRYCDVAIPDDAKGRPWWEAQHVRLKDVRRAIEFMCASYDPSSNKVNGVSTGPGANSSDGERSIYVALSTDGAGDGYDSTRLKDEGRGESPFNPPAVYSERRQSNASSVGVKRERESEQQAHPHSNGVAKDVQESKRQRLDEGDRDPSGALQATPLDPAAPRGDPKLREEAERVRDANLKAEVDVAIADAAGKVDRGGARNGEAKVEEVDVEEGEVEE